MVTQTSCLPDECTLENGVHFRRIQDSRFKTQRISVNMMVPLQKETAAANALIPYLLCRTNRAYPDYTKLGQRLCELYGASLNGDIQKLGDVQVLSVTAAGLADRYALHGEKISSELTELLCSAIFDPVLDEDGLFPIDGFEQEKRQTLETIDSEMGDKRLYAKKKGLELLLGDEPAAISRYGTREQVEALTREEVTQAWKQLLKIARFEVMVLGDASPELVLQKLRGKFSAERNPVCCKTDALPSAGPVKEKQEQMDVTQCKMILGFRTGVSAQQWEQIPALKLMSAILGGTPHSKLFVNVREKESLCYYCSSRYDTNKGVLLIESGVEEEQLDHAKKAMLEQLDEIQQGNITEEELQSAKLSMCNSLETVEDYLYGMESWYLSQTFHPRTITPKESADEIQQVTIQQVQQAASLCKLDAVYVLRGTNSGEGEEE